MSVTISSLEYKNKNATVSRYMRDNYSWLYDMTTLSGVKDVGHIMDLDVNTTLLKTADCVEDNVNTEVKLKDVEMDYYNLSFPVTKCELERTWLSAFASKYRDAEEVYIDNLIPFLSEKLHDEVRAKVQEQIITEATADANVSKVTVTGGGSPTAAYTSIVDFIDGFSEEFLARSLDRWSDTYSIYVSPDKFKNVMNHLGDKVDGLYAYIGGYRVLSNKSLTGNQMICTRSRNLAVMFDDAQDLNRIVISEKEWLSTYFINFGLAFKATYLDASDIVISN